MSGRLGSFVSLLCVLSEAQLTPDDAQAWRETSDAFDWQQAEPDAVVRIAGQGVQDAAGNLYFAGSKTTGTSVDALDMFVAKINVDDSLGWTRQYGTEETDAATFITIINETSATGVVTEQLYVAGYTWGYLDEGGHALNGFGRYGGRDAVLAKMSLDGDKLWMRQFGTTANDFVYGVSLDGSFNSLLVSGGCETNQLDETVEVDVADILATRTNAGGFSDYEPQIMDPEARSSAEHRQYDFAVSLNFSGDILDYAMDGGVTLTPRRQRIREGGLVAEYAVVLNRQPLADVVVQAADVRLLDPSNNPVHQLQFQTSQQVIFSPSNWNREQYVRLTALDDALAEGRHYAVVTHSVASADPNFDGTETPFLFGRNVTVQIDDNDRAGVSLSRQHVFVAEGGGKDSYDVVLTSQPWHPVKVVIVPLHVNQTSVTPGALGVGTSNGTAQFVFHPGDWDIPQRVLVSAVDDTESEVEYGGLYNGGPLLHYTESKDIRYHTRRPQCFDVPNCDPLDPSVCLWSVDELDVGQTSVQVCDLTRECAFSMGNGACLVNVMNGGGKVPERFGSDPLDPGSTEQTVAYMSYDSLQNLIESQMSDTIIAAMNVTMNTSTAMGEFVEPPPELRGFVLSFLGLMNVDQARRMSISPINVLHTICAGLVRLETMRWAFEEWPSGYVERVLNATFSMFPQNYSLERHAWNCGMAVFLPGSNITTTIWDNDPGITLSTTVLDVSEGQPGASYDVVLNAPPSVGGLAQIASSSGIAQVSSAYCVNKQVDSCGFWGANFSALAAAIYDQSAWSENIAPNVSIAVVGNSQIAVSPSLLTFSATNWFIPQRVTVIAIDDAIAEPNATYTISHRVQNSQFGYTNMTSFWFRGTVGLAGIDFFPEWNAVNGGSIPYNLVPTVLRSPNHERINVIVRDNDVAGVNVIPNQPPPGVATKEASDTVLQWVGDYVTALAFHDISLTPATTNDATTQAVLSNILMFAPKVVTFMKFHLPQLHDGDTNLAFSAAALILHQTPYKIINASDVQSGSNSSGNDSTSTDQASFSKLYRLNVTLVDNAWTTETIGTVTVTPKPLSFLPTNFIQVTATVERSRSIEVDIFPLLQQVLPTRLSVISLRIDVLAEGNNTSSFATTQLCSSLFERQLRPVLSLGYRFPNILGGLTANQSSTAVVPPTGTSLSASLATSGAAYNDSVSSTVAVATTNNETEPWWEVTLPQLTKLGTLAVFLPASILNGTTGTVNIVLIASLTAFNSKPLSLKDAVSYGCPSACPRVQRLPVRKGILLWDIQAGAVAIRIYRKGTGSLQLAQVQAFDPFLMVTPTANASGIRSRLKSSWSPNTAALQPWRLLQTVRKSEDENLATRMATRQSSTSPSDALSYLAVDGLRHSGWDPLVVETGDNTTIAAGSTRTNTNTTDPWWEVDLGSVKPIRSVILYPYVGNHYEELCAPVSTGGNGYPTWSGDLYDYNHVDPLLMLKAPFAQNFEVVISALSLRNDDGTPSGAPITASSTLSFSCANYSNSIVWSNVFSKGRFVTVRKSGLTTLMLNEVEVIRWNPATYSRFLLLDLFGKGDKPLAVANAQVFPPGDVAPSSNATLVAPSPISYTIHSVSSQLATSGAGSANALMNNKDTTQCYVASGPSYHEWVVLDFGTPVRIGLIDVNLNVSQCSSTNVGPVTEFSVASHGIVLDGIRSTTSLQALAAEGAPTACALTAMGAVVAPSSSCTSFVCPPSACQMPLRAQSAAQNSVVFGDFVDIAVLGKVSLLPTRRLPLSQNEHRTVVLRDNPVVLWPFDNSSKAFVSQDFISWEGNSRATGGLDFRTVADSTSLKISDTKENTFFSSAVIIQPAMSSFTVEFWLQFNGDVVAPPVDIFSLYGVDGTGNQVSFGRLGIASSTGRFFFEVTNPTDGTTCRADLGNDAAVLPIGNAWHHMIAIYDPVSTNVSLSACVPVQPQSPQCFSNGATCNMTMLTMQQKVIRFGASPVTASGFTGKITNVAWYVRALVFTEVMDHYHDFLEGVVADITGAHNTYAIGLSTRPLQPVTIKVDAEIGCYRFNLCNVSAIPSVLTFTAEDWAASKLVHVLATDDQLYEGLHHSGISHTAFSAPSYELTSAASVANVNSDTSDGQEFLSELDKQVSTFYRDLVMYDVLENATLRFERQDALVALQASWAAQTVGQVPVAANAYASTIPVASISVTIADLTVPGIEFSTISLSVSEDGKGNDYQVVLLSEPTQPVTVTLRIASGCYRKCVQAPLCPSHTVELASGDVATSNSTSFLNCGDVSASMASSQLLCNITMTPDVLVFSGINWNLPQTVRVLAVDDHIDEADVHVAVISATSRSLDPVYDQLPLPDIVVAIADNDIADMAYSVKLVNLSESGANQSILKYPSGDYYTLQLLTEPYANVTIAMSNEANKACYRRCGYPVDPTSCGLPRQQSVSLVQLRSNSSREIHQITLSIPKVTEVQRIVTYASHVDQIVRLRVSGGFGPEVQSIVFQFNDAFKQQYPSSNAVEVASNYGGTFVVSTTAGASTSALDLFATSQQIQTAVNSLFSGGSSAVAATRDLQYSQSTLTWTITFLRFVSTDGTFPLLSVTASTTINGTVTCQRMRPVSSPSGTYTLSYGAITFQLPVLTTAAALQSALSSQAGIYSVSVSQGIPASSDYGFEYSITFISVDSYEFLTVNSSSTAVSAVNATSQVLVSVVETQSPVRISGSFVINYFSPYNATNPTKANQTVPIFWNDSADVLSSKLAQLQGVGNVTVTRRRLSGEGAMAWTVQFLQNNGNLSSMIATSFNLSGQGVSIAVSTIRDGQSLRGNFSIQMGGWFKKTDWRTSRAYMMNLPLQNTTLLPFNASSNQVQAALFALNITELADVSLGGDCDAFNICNGYTWNITYSNSPGNLPPIAVFADDYLHTVPGAVISSTTIANGTYLGGNFTLRLELLDPYTNLSYVGTTWRLPVNVSAIGMDEALEALSFVRSNREAEYDPETLIWRGIKFDKGVRVYREGPYLDGGHTWRLEWALEDYMRFADLKITMDVSLVTQEIDPLPVPSQLDLQGMPRCSAIPTAIFQADPTDPLGLRGFCVYAIANETAQERFLCNYTVLNPWIVFTPENWCIPQQVRLESVDDHLDEYSKENGNVTYSQVTHTVYSDDYIYLALPLPNVTVKVESDDVAKVLVSESELVVSEDGALVAQYYLQLNSEPLANVKIVVLPWLDSNNTKCYRFGLCNVTLPVSEFVFTPQNWYVPQTVIVQATDDSLDEYDIHMTGISHLSYSDDPKYNAIPSIPKINVSVRDNDVSGFVVNKTSVFVTEGLGAIDAYSVVLTSEPFAKVTVSVTNIATVGNLATPSPAQLVFTWFNWNISQTVGVTAFDDYTQDPIGSSSILSHSLKTNDLIYAALRNLSVVTVFITDNDVSGINVSTHILQGPESNSSVLMYGVRLTSEPWNPVVVQPNASHNCYLRIQTAERVCNASILSGSNSLYFSAMNWSVWQNVSLIAVDDWLDEAPIHTTRISHASTSQDALYSVSDYATTGGDITLYITDNDISFVNISMQSTTNQVHVAEGSFNDSYNIFLNTEPYEYVTISLRPVIEKIVSLANSTRVFYQPQEGVAYGSLASSSTTWPGNSSVLSVQLVFTPVDWARPRVVTVFAIDDGIPEQATQYSTILHSISSADAKYNTSNSSIGVVNVSVMINDRETIPPPLPLNASFDNAGSKITVTFDSTVYHAASMDVTTSGDFVIRLKTFSCSLVFQLATARYSLGAQASCLWLDWKNLLIQLDSGATIAAGDKLVLNGCASFANQICNSTSVLRALPSSRAFSQASIAVQVPSDIIKPSVVLVVPENTGSCGSWSVDASLSSGAGGRPYAQLVWFALPVSLFPNASALSGADDSLLLYQKINASLDLLCQKYSLDWRNGKSSITLIPAADIALAAVGNSSTASVLASLTTMAQLRSTCYLRSIMQNSTGTAALQLQINSSLIEPGTTYRIGLRLANAFAQATAAVKSINVQSLPGPAVSIVGDSTQNVTRTGAPVVMQVTSVVSCPSLSGADVAYRWTTTSQSSNGSGAVTTEDFSAANLARDPRVFRLARSSLQSGRIYTFRVEAYLSGLSSNQSSSSFASIVVSVFSSALQVVVMGGDCALGSRDSLILDGSSTIDPDASSDSFTYAWGCRDVTNLTDTSLVGAACMNASTTPAAPLDLSATTGAILKVSPFNLVSGRQLKFSLTATKGSRSGTASSTIWTVAGSLPVVHVIASAAKINPSSRLTLVGSVDSSYPYSARWMQAQGDLVLPNATTRNTSDAFSMPLTTTSHAIRSFKLTAGLTYEFRLLAIDTVGNVGFGSVSVVVNAPPTSGTFVVTPQSGFAMQDSFTLTCSMWSDDVADYPLTYAFGVLPASEFAAMENITDPNALVDKLQRLLTPLVPSQLSPQAVTTMLPPDSMSESENMTVIAFISDNLGAVTVANTTIEVNLPTSVLTQPVEYAASLLNSTNSTLSRGNPTQQVRQMLSAALVLEKAVGTGTTSGNSAARRLSSSCPEGFMGTNCTIQISAVNKLIGVMLNTLSSVAVNMEPTSSCLGQQARILGSIMRTAPEMLMAQYVSNVTQVSSGVANSALGLSVSTDFLASTAETLLEVVSTAVTLISPTGASSASVGTRRLVESTTTSSASASASASVSASGTCADEQATATVKTSWVNAVTTLQALAALSSQGLLTNEPPAVLEVAAVNTFSSPGVDFTALPTSSLAMNLTRTSIDCLGSNLFLNALTLATSPHSACTLNASQAISRLTLFSVHSQAAFDQAAASTNLSADTGITMKTLSTSSVCVAQATESARRLMSSVADAEGTKWTPLMAITIPHVRELTPIEQSNFSTACRTWDTEMSSWSVDVCFKDDSTSTSEFTVCYCTQVEEALEVLITLEERLDFYALHPDLYRNDPPSLVVSVTFVLLIGTFVILAKAGQSLDVRDVKREKLASIVKLNRAKWSELQARTKAGNVFEDFDAYYVAQKKKRLESHPSEAQTAFTDVGESSMSGARVHNLSLMAPSNAPVDPTVQLPDEARTLFGSVSQVDRQYKRVTMLFRTSNLMLALVGIVLLFAGIQVQFVLGRTPAELVFYLYSGHIGFVLIGSGVLLLIGGISGVLLSRREASNGARATYLACAGFGLLAQLLVVAFLFQALENFNDLPRGVALALRSQWDALSLNDKSRLQGAFGCCGFLSISEEVSCPEEALDAVPPRTCSVVLGAQATTLYSTSFVYVQVIFFVEIACVVLANLLVRWRRIRLLQLATSDSSPSAETTILRSLFSVVLLCSLPPLYTLLACAAAGAVFFGVDLILRWGLLADSLVGALFGIEVGGLVVVSATVYLILSLRALHVLGMRDVRGLRWVVVFSLIFLLFTAAVYGYLMRLLGAFYVDPAIIQAVETKYVALPKSTTLLKLEMGMGCCGFRSKMQGACVEEASDGIPLCREQVEFALIRAISLAKGRLVGFAVAQSAVTVLSMLLCLHLRRFSGLAAVRSTISEPQIACLPPTTFHQVCVVGLVLLNFAGAAAGLGVVSVGVDVLLKLNVFQITYLFRVFDRHLGIYLVAGGGAIEIFAALGGTAAWIMAKGIPQRPYMKKRLKWMVVGYSVLCIAIFVASFTVLGVAHKFSSQLSVASSGSDDTTAKAIAANVRLKELWSMAPSTTQQFVQNSLQCCGYERIEAANGSVTYTLQPQEIAWRRLSSTSTYHVYNLQDSDILQTRELTETQAEAAALGNSAQCPPNAAEGCATSMKRYVSRISRVAWQVCCGFAAFSVISLLCVSGLHDDSRSQRSWHPRVRLQVTRTILLVVVLLGVLISLVCLVLGLDVAAGWTLFSSSALQMMFSRSIGSVLIVYAVLALSAHVYSARAALSFSVHRLFLQGMARSVLVIALLAGVGLTAHLTHYSTASEQTWRLQLTSFLSDQWNDLAPKMMYEVSLEFACCGFHDPVLMAGHGIVFDRPALGYPGCSLAISQGCKTPLVKGVESSFAWLFALFLSLALMEMLIAVLGAIVLRDVRNYEVEAWFALESRLRYVAGSFQRDFRRRHVLVSIAARFDGKLTRAQRCVSVLCAWAGSLTIYAGYFATKGCYRTSLKSCEQPGVWVLLGLGLVYGGIVGVIVQTLVIALFDHVRNRTDDESKEVATARQRKEKVLLFRSPWFRRRRQGAIQETSQHSLALPFEDSTLDSTQTTTEERWFVWLTRFVAATFQACAVVLFLGGCALATLLGLLQLGYNNSLYGVPLDENLPLLLGLAVGLVVVALGAALANDLREQQLKQSHRRKVTAVLVAMVLAAIAAVLALGGVLLAVFMMHEVVQADASALTIWSVRTTGFSVVERLESAWKEELTSYDKDSIQQELRCCGFASATDAPFTPCPDGDLVEVTYQALSVTGTVVDKTQQEYTTLPGCRAGMLAQFHRGADVATYCALAGAGVLFLLAISAVFLAREFAISKDAKLKVRVPESTADTEDVKKDVRETFETVVGLKIAPPTRGKLRSQLLASSLESVTPTVASELAAASVKHEQVLLANSPMTHGADEEKSIGDDITNTGSVGAESNNNVPYPASIVYVVFAICFLWLVAMAYVVAISAMELGLVTSWRCVLAWAVGVGMQVLVVEPSFILAAIVSRTLKDWWSRTLVARLVRRGRAALRIGPQSLEREQMAKSLSLYDRLRYAAAVRIQRRLLTRVMRVRYLRQLRAHKQEQHRSLAVQRRETLRKTLGHFSEEEIEAFRLVFVSADPAQLGLISHTAIAQAVYELGVHVPTSKVRELLFAFDPAYADLVDFEHFLYGMHCVRQYHQQLQSQATNPEQSANTGKRVDDEKLVSSSDRFGPSADPRAELLVKRQNLLRELKDRRESLAHKLLRKMSGRVPIMQRGKSAQTATTIDETNAEETSQATTTSEEPAQPTGTYVFWQNRKLSPKKRALESALKKNHKERLRQEQRPGKETDLESDASISASRPIASPAANASARRALKEMASKKLPSRGNTTGTPVLDTVQGEVVAPPTPPAPTATEDEQKPASIEMPAQIVSLPVETTVSVDTRKHSTDLAVSDSASPSNSEERAPQPAEAQPFGAYMLLTKQSPLLQNRGQKPKDTAAEGPGGGDSSSRPATADKSKPSGAHSALGKALKKQKARGKPT